MQNFGSQFRQQESNVPPGNSYTAGAHIVDRANDFTGGIGTIGGDWSIRF
jgi:hypothetical protein